MSVKHLKKADNWLVWHQSKIWQRAGLCGLRAVPQFFDNNLLIQFFIVYIDYANLFAIVAIAEVQLYTRLFDFR